MSEVLSLNGQPLTMRNFFEDGKILKHSSEYYNLLKESFSLTLMDMYRESLWLNEHMGLSETQKSLLFTEAGDESVKKLAGPIEAAWKTKLRGIIKTILGMVKRVWTAIKNGLKLLWKKFGGDYRRIFDLHARMSSINRAWQKQASDDEHTVLEGNVRAMINFLQILIDLDEKDQKFREKYTRGFLAKDNLIEELKQLAQHLIPPNEGTDWQANRQKFFDMIESVHFTSMIYVPQFLMNIGEIEFKLNAILESVKSKSNLEDTITKANELAAQILSAHKITDAFVEEKDLAKVLEVSEKASEAFDKRMGELMNSWIFKPGEAGVDADEHQAVFGGIMTTLTDVASNFHTTAARSIEILKKHLERREKALKGLEALIAHLEATGPGRKSSAKEARASEKAERERQEAKKKKAKEDDERYRQQQEDEESAAAA